MSERFETSHTEVEARLLDGAVFPGARVLEAGCGRRTRLARRREMIGELVGIDVDENAGTENDALDRFVVTDLCAHLPFEDASFDLVYANFVVEHLTDPQAAFREWRRVLRPGGRTVLLTSNTANPFLRAAALLPQRLRVRLKARGPGAVEDDVFPAVYRANTPRRLERLMAEAGFVPVDVAYVATLHRYAGPRARLAAALRLAERILPARLRSTIVASYSATAREGSDTADPASPRP
jgi:ubiquinone/menaquinone biosynthesis C-methylase UbiE